MTVRDLKRAIAKLPEYKLDYEVVFVDTEFAEGEPEINIRSVFEMHGPDMLYLDAAKIKEEEWSNVRVLAQD